MATDFPDYIRGPGFWFLFEMLIAQDVCLNPIFSAKFTDFSISAKGEEDFYEAIEAGLKAYERTHKYIKQMEW